jgi:DNA-binding beta-propeller fold protein YncE
MFSHRPWGKRCPAVLVSGLLALCVLSSPTAAWDGTFANSSQAAQPIVEQTSASLSFVRAFSSADDVRREHPVLDRTLDIIAGPADPEARVDAMRSPSAATTDSNQRVFVADPGAKAVHIFDFVRSKYDRLDRRGDHLQVPVSLAVDGQDNLYVVDQSSRSVLVYDSTGKFRRRLGKLRGGESYFDNPAGIAIDKAARRIYVCDRQGHMIFVMDERGKLIRKLGNRGGGNRPGEFRFPSEIVVAGSEVFVLDAGNTRIQVFDTGGHFLRAMNLGYADRHTGLAVDNRGNIYVSDSGLNQIQVLGHEGQRLYTFDPSTVRGANFSHPSGMWADAGHSLYAVDSQSNRVGLFQINGANAPQ